MFKGEDLFEAEQLVKAIHFFSDRGWTPATSSNFSFLTQKGEIAISESGIDKSEFQINHLILLDEKGKLIENTERKSSAETLIHLEIYNSCKAKCVLHTHSPHSTVLSMYVNNDMIRFSNYEVQKGIKGKETHEGDLVLSIFENSQNMEKFTQKMKEGSIINSSCRGFLIRGHGLYAWGDNVFEAKRHIETYEFLLKCELLRMGIKN